MEELDAEFTKEAKCLKCGWGVVEMVYDVLSDRLDCTCAKCGYCWLMKPADLGEK